MNPSGGLVQSAVNAPMTVDIPDSFLNEALQFREMMMMYTCAIREVKTKLEVLNDDLAVRYHPDDQIQGEEAVKHPGKAETPGISGERPVGGGKPLRCGRDPGDLLLHRRYLCGG